MPPRRMPHVDQAGEVQGELGREGPEKVCPQGDIPKGHRPATPIAEPTVFQIPDGQPRLSERRPQLCDEGQTVLGLPTAPVEEEHHWMRARLLREIEIPELGRVWTIGEAMISGHPRQGYDLVQRQDAGWLWVHGGHSDVPPSSPFGTTAYKVNHINADGEPPLEVVSSSASVRSPTDVRCLTQPFLTLLQNAPTSRGLLHARAG